MAKVEESKKNNRNRNTSNPKEFEINEYITLKLERKVTIIYVDGIRFIQCIRLIINIPKEDIDYFDEIKSIDEAAELSDKFLHKNKIYKEEDGKLHLYDNTIDITPEEEFQAHCSNLQVWSENGYDTRLLRSNLAFPLLKELYKAGDPQAKKVFKEEIAERFLEGNYNQKKYLAKENYLNYLNEEEFDSLFKTYIELLNELKFDKEKDAELTFMIKLGLKYLQNKKIKKVVDTIHTFKKKEIDIKEICFQLGRSYIDKSKRKKAKTILKIGLEYYPNDIDMWWNLGFLYRSKIKYNKAINAFQHAHEIDPNNLNVKIQLGITYNDMKKYHIAINIFKDVLKVDQKILVAWCHLSDAYLDMENSNEAVRTLKKAIKICPNNTMLLDHLGHIYCELGFISDNIKWYKDAIKTYKKAICTDPENYDLWYSLGTTFQEKGEIDNAIETYYNVLKLNKKHIFTYISLIGIYQKKKDVKNIILWSKRTLSYFPDLDFALDILCDIYCERKEYDNAIELCKKGIIHKASQNENIFPVEWMRLGKLYYEKGAYKEAIDVFIRALKINPRNQEVWEYIILVCKANGDFLGEFLAINGLFRFL